MNLPRTGTNARSQPRRQLSDGAIIRLFILPTLILLIVVNIFPLFYSLYLSFTDYSAISRADPVWVGLKNFKDILNNKQLWIYFATTGRYALLAVSLETLVGFGLAMLGYGTQLAVGTWSAITPMIGISQGWDYVPVAVGGALIALFSVERLLMVLAGTDEAVDAAAPLIE